MAKTKQDELFEDGDSSLSFDMEAVAAQSFEVIPKGIYPAVVENVEFKMSSTDQPMWSITFVLTDGDFAGRKIFDNMSFAPKALPFTKARLARLAPELISNRFNPKAIAESGDLIGKTIKLKTKIEPYNGEDQTRIASYLPAVSGSGFED